MVEEKEVCTCCQNRRIRTTKKKRYDDDVAQFDPVSILKSMCSPSDNENSKQNKKKLNKKKKKEQCMYLRSKSKSSGNDSDSIENKFSEQHTLNDFIYEEEDIEFEQSLLMFKERLDNIPKN